MKITITFILSILCCQLAAQTAMYPVYAITTNYGATWSNIVQPDDLPAQYWPTGNSNAASSAVLSLINMRVGKVTFASALSTNGTVTFSTPMPGTNYEVAFTAHGSGGAVPAISWSNPGVSNFTCTVSAPFVGTFSYVAIIQQ